MRVEVRLKHRHFDEVMPSTVPENSLPRASLYGPTALIDLRLQGRCVEVKDAAVQTPQANLAETPCVDEHDGVAPRDNTSHSGCRTEHVTLKRSRFSAAPIRVAALG